jgi:nicotinate-nucleotide pyrophosphorylase (carboxylating)
MLQGMDSLMSKDMDNLIRAALEEDVGPGDVTTLATIPEGMVMEAAMVARKPLVVAGLPVVERVYQRLDPAVSLEPLAADGQAMKAGEVLLRVRGAARPILSGERVALNFIQRLSGIATLTAQYVAEVAGTKARILDTRKTTPGWRRLEKYAVRCGGGQNHRFGLFDMVLIKDNHLAALGHEQPNPVAAAVQRARQQYPGLKVEVEADTLEQAVQAAEAGADIILLDNMTPEQLREAAGRVGKRALTEASGGVNLGTVRAIALSGVDYISVGALTHSAVAVDIGLDFA